MANFRVQTKWLAISFVIIAAVAAFAGTQQPVGRLPQSLRLYIFDCGTLHFTNADTYQLKAEEVASLDMSVPCYLVAHPRGTMIWDAGMVPDISLKATGEPVRMKIQLPDSQQRDVTVTKPLTAQLSEAGFSPRDITYVAVSHFHWDHIGNMNDFASSTWLTPKAERDIMFSDPPSLRTFPANFSALRNSRTIFIEKDEYDVFGDGQVVLKSAPGHSPGHQVLFLNLKATGPVLLSGDLYHYPEERALNRLPTREFNVEQTVASRAAIEAYMKTTGAQLWIQHDSAANAKLRKSPLYYD